jgi:uncharacterized damage-inducible protein DinB
MDSAAVHPRRWRPAGASKALVGSSVVPVVPVAVPFGILPDRFDLMTGGMMKTFLAALCVVSAAAASISAASPEQAGGSNALRDSIRGPYTAVKGNIIKSLELVPEATLTFRPTPDVRTLGQLFGHVANANYLFCSVSTGSKPATSANAEQLKTKAELAKALADSFAFCDSAFDAVTDQNAGQAVTIGFINNMPSTKLGVLAFNSAHDWEHYGNIVTYLRMNKIVPPSSAK